MKKKIGIVILATMMATLVACGNDSKTGSNETGTVTTNNETENNTQENTTEEKQESNSDELTDEYLLSLPETEPSSFNYKEQKDGTIQIDYYLGTNDGNDIVVIPSQIDGKNVTKISNGAFANANVKAVVTGKNVSIIAGESFSSIKAEKILINGPVEEIYECAFVLAEASYITLPEGLKIIGPNAFLSAGMKEITIPASVNEIGVTAFSKVSAEVVVIKSNSVEIQNLAFASMKNLKKIYIPSGDISFLTDVFYKSENVTVFTPAGSSAEEYAKANGINFETLD